MKRMSQTTRSLRLAACLVLAGCMGRSASAAPEDGSGLKLWYKQPATKWTEALPVGNGRLGAMVFGGTQTERIQLNEDTLWAGSPANRDRKGAHKHLPEARRLIFEGKYVEAQQLVQREFMGPRWIRSFQTLGDLELGFTTNEPVADYRRQLDLDTAIAQVTYRRGEVTVTQEVFASVPDQCIVVRLTTDKPGELTFDAKLSRPADATTQASEPDTMIMTGRATQDGQYPGVSFEARVRIIPDGGTVAPHEKGLRVENANAATILIVAGTDYRGGEPDRLCKDYLVRAADKPYPALKTEHIVEHRRLFRRVQLDLGTGAAGPTDERLNAVQAGGQDADLIALYFQFGRYLLMSSSRPGCMPANLQGLWNEHLKAPWNCDYHININIQMNYWPAEVCNLSECHEPFFDLIDNLRPEGRKTAQDVYGCRGFVAHHTTDAWWWTSPIGNVGYGLWQTGAAWCCQHLWEHYLFTGDKPFLAERAYPIMKEAAQFFLDYLVEHPKTGELVCGPSISPENRFRTPDGKAAHITMGPAMDQQIIFGLFTNCLSAAKVLDIEDEFTSQTAEALGKLAGPKIGPDGRLLEWNEPFDEPAPGHRHVSHLFALHPGKQISVTKTPELAAAARKSLEFRLANGGGHTGWSRAWIINFWARLRDAEKAHENVVALLQKSTHPNLFDNHPPFQVDGNFGGTAGITEMLLQSHADEIHLLPALPKAWPTGHVTGLRARGGFEVDISWRDGKLSRATIRAARTGPCKVRYSQKTIEQRLRAGRQIEVGADMF